MTQCPICMSEGEVSSANNDLRERLEYQRPDRVTLPLPCILSIYRCAELGIEELSKQELKVRAGQAMMPCMNSESAWQIRQCCSVEIFSMQKAMQRRPMLGESCMLWIHKLLSMPAYTETAGRPWLHWMQTKSH